MRKKSWAKVNDISVFVLSAGGSVLRAVIENGASAAVMAPAIVLGWSAVALWEYVAPAILKKVNHTGRRNNIIRFFAAPCIGWFSADIIDLVRQWAETKTAGG